ncbi:MAG: hypothetical protein P8Z42_09125, partial [Anaerolineales bacterium]
MEKLLKVVVGRILPHNVVSGEHPLRICVYHEDRPVQGVKDYGVGRFRAYSVDGKQLSPDRRLIPASHFTHAPPILHGEKFDKVLQSLCLDIEIAGRLYQFGQLPDRHEMKPFRIEQPLFLKVAYRLFAAFGPQHWWAGETALEVAVGAVLTQNTNWRNVEKAI